MTNPNNLIEIPTPFPSETITAIVYFKPNVSKYVLNGNLWIGTKDGSLYIAEEVIGSRTSFIFRSALRTARKNFLVKEIIPIYEDPPCTLVHWIGGNGQPGPVQVIYPGGVRVQIFEEANRILYTTIKSKAKNSENRSLIGILNGQSITFFEFIGDMVIEKSKIDQLTDGFIEAIEMGEDSIIYFSKGKYHKYDLNDSTDTKISTSTVGEFKNKINPFIIKVASKTFIVGYKEFMMIIGLKSREGEAMIQYDKNNKVPNRILVYRDVMYQFFDGLFTRQPIIPPPTGVEPQSFNFNSVFLSCMVNDNLIIVTPTSVQMIGTIPQPSDMANKIIKNGGIYDEFEDLMKKLSNEQVSEIISDIFDILWKNNKYEIAFKLISTHIILNNINKYVSLMPILIIDVPDENAISLPNSKNQTNLDTSQISLQKRNYIISPDMKPLEENDARYLNNMLEFLSFTRSVYMQNVFKYKDRIRDVNTVLAQCYAAFSKTRELDELITENHLDLKPLQYFIKERSKILSLNPSYAILQSNIGEVDEAINIWRKLDIVLAKNNKFNPMFITEASYAVQKLKDSSNLISYLNWILERDQNSPELAINAILSVNHDPTEINAWLSSKGLENYKLRYCVYIVTQSNASSKNSISASAGKASTLANETFVSLLDILADIDDSDFDLNRLQFTKCSKGGSTGGVFKLNAKKEIFQYLMKILELHADSINEAEAEDHITDNIDIKIKFALYRVKRMYEKGLKLMLQNYNSGNDGSEFPEEKVQEFCRLAPEPEVAFSVLINMIDPNDLIPKFKKFILENLAFMNLPDLISRIPKNLKMNEVQLILKKAYNILQSRVYSLDNQIAIAKSVKIDTLYRRTQLQANFCHLKKEVRCAKCGNKILEEQQCVMAPGGTNMLVYHPRCKPTLFT